jgi:hypothetical protein
MRRTFDDVIEAVGIAFLISTALLLVCLMIPSTRVDLLSYVHAIHQDMMLSKFSPAKIRKTCAKLTDSRDLYSECYIPIIESTFQKEALSVKNLGPSIQLGRMTLKSEHQLFDADDNKSEILGRRLKEVHLLLSGLHWSRSISKAPTESELSLAQTVRKELLVSYVRTSQSLRTELRSELSGLGTAGRELVRRLNEYDRDFVKLVKGV